MKSLPTMELKVYFPFKIKFPKLWDARVAQSVKRLTIDFISGHDLAVHETDPHVGLYVVSLGFSLSPSLPLPSPNCTPSFKINKINI